MQKKSIAEQTQAEIDDTNKLIGVINACLLSDPDSFALYLSLRGLQGRKEELELELRNTMQEA